MRKFLPFVFILICLISSTKPLSAQEKTITGKVLGEENLALSGVTVLVKGTKIVTTTDQNGTFTIKADPKQTLVFTSLNYLKKEVSIGTKTEINIQLTASQDQLDEVVVVAMDIKRNTRELGYSTQNVSGKDIQSTQRDNFINSLQGRVAGLSVTPTTGAAGASSGIILRGFNTLSGTNQPLFIVDGIILDNSTLNTNSQGGSGIGLASDLPNRNNDYTNRIADINPNDIDNVTILKGPEATALYGSQASNGAIVITTKKIYHYFQHQPNRCSEEEEIGGVA
jgi:TonB-dependent SusC/RagA subfamily outer membrane receptor